jgi:hypothetical protein
MRTFSLPGGKFRRNCEAKLLDWIRVRLATPLLHAVPVVAYHVPVDHGGMSIGWQSSRNHPSASRFLCLAFFPSL